MNYGQAAHAGQGRLHSCVCVHSSRRNSPALPVCWALDQILPPLQLLPRRLQSVGSWSQRGGWGGHVRNASSPAYLSCSQGWVQQGLPTYRSLWPVSLGRWGGGEWLGPMGRTRQSPLPPLHFPVGARRCQGDSDLWCGCCFISAGPRCLLWGAACSLSHRALGQSHSAHEEMQGDRTGLCPASFSSEF